MEDVGFKALKNEKSSQVTIQVLHFISMIVVDLFSISQIYYDMRSKLISNTNIRRLWVHHLD